MDWKRIGLGLAAFTVGAVAWTVGAAKLAPRPNDVEGGSALPQEGAVPGDSVTAPINPRPNTMAAAPVGMAEAEKDLAQGKPDMTDGHVPTDLLASEPPRSGDRAPEAFRPDPTAIPTAEEREALRPATGPAPTLVADRGSGFSEAAGAA